MFWEIVPSPYCIFKHQGVLGQYRSPETKYLLEGAWDPDGYWSGITTDLLLTGFNHTVALEISRTEELR